MFDVVVVGAGISGLSAARRLEEYGLTVLVVEARDRVGGRTYTVRDSNNGTVDLGGAYVGPTQFRVNRLARDLGLQLYNVRDDNKSVMELKDFIGQHISEIPPFLNPIKLLDLNHIVRTLDSMASQVPLSAPWTAKRADEWDRMTVNYFIDTIAWTRSAKDAVIVFIRALFCAEPSELSLLFVLWYIHSGGGVARMSRVTNGAQEKKIVGGSMQLSEKMAEGLKNSVNLSCPVAKVEQTQDVVIVTDCHGNKYQAKHVISAVPQSLLNRIDFEPSLPWQRIQLVQRMPMGCIIKTVMFYKTQFWRDLDLNGQAASSEGVCCYSIDDTKPDGSHPAIMGFVLAERARELALRSPDDRKQSLCLHYARVFNCKDFLFPTDYMEYNWMADPYSGGCYASIMPPNALTAFARYLRDPAGRVYFAGTETSTHHIGYMDGAIESGERAANQILASIGKISEDEIYQDEPEDPDHPAEPIKHNQVEWYLPSVSAVIKFSCFVAAGFITSTAYYFLVSWRGVLLRRWVSWQYDLDEYSLHNLSAYIPILDPFKKK